MLRPGLYKQVINTALNRELSEIPDTRKYELRQYHKLSRNRIPEINEDSGKTCVYEILSDTDYLRLDIGEIGAGTGRQGG